MRTVTLNFGGRLFPHGLRGKTVRNAHDVAVQCGRLDYILVQRKRDVLRVNVSKIISRRMTLVLELLEFHSRSERDIDRHPSEIFQIKLDRKSVV